MSKSMVLATIAVALSLLAATGSAGVREMQCCKGKKHGMKEGEHGGHQMGGHDESHKADMEAFHFSSTTAKRLLVR